MVGPCSGRKKPSDVLGGHFSDAPLVLTINAKDGMNVSRIEKIFNKSVGVREVECVQALLLVVGGN